MYSRVLTRWIAARSVRLAIASSAIGWALLGLSCLGVVPGLVLVVSELDVDITSGRLRQARTVYAMPVWVKTCETALSRAMPRPEAIGGKPDWHRVATISPGFTSPHHRYHGAAHQIRLLELAWQAGNFSPSARRAAAERILQLWREAGDDHAAEGYLDALFTLVSQAQNSERSIETADLALMR